MAINVATGGKKNDPKRDFGNLMSLTPEEIKERKSEKIEAPKPKVEAKAPASDTKKKKKKKKTTKKKVASG